MKLQISANVSVIAVAVVLACCASKAPVESTGAASTDASAQDETSAEYRKLADNAEKPVVCRRQAVTGTLIPSVVCLTPEEIAERRDSALQVMHDIHESQAMSRSMADRPVTPPSAPRGSP